MQPKKLFLDGTPMVVGLPRIRTRIPLIYPKIDSLATLTDAERQIVDGLGNAEKLLDHCLREGGAFAAPFAQVFSFI